MMPRGLGSSVTSIWKSPMSDIAESMTEMILTQRAYQLNAKSITTADEMLEVINTII